MEDLEDSLCRRMGSWTLGLSGLLNVGWVYMAETGRIPVLALRWFNGIMVGYWGN